MDEYLNSSAYIQKLAQAEWDCQLDETAVLEKLANAASHCGKKSDEYYMARAAYVGEIYRRVVLTRSQAASIGNAVRFGRKIAEAPRGFEGWCKKARISRSTAHALVKISQSNEPAKALVDLRARGALRNESVRKRAHGALSSQKEAEQNPIAHAVKVLRKLSPVQLAEVLRRMGVSAPRSADQALEDYLKRAA